MMMQDICKSELDDMCPPGMFPGMEAEFMSIQDNFDPDDKNIQLRTHPSSSQMNINELGKRVLEAARNGDTNEVFSLVTSGAPFTNDWLGATALHYAAQFGHTDTVRVLLENGALKDARTKIDRTALHVAAQEGFLETCKVLIEYDCDVDPLDMLKMTPLHWAAQGGHKEVIEFLLENGADVTAKNKFDKTPIDIAENEGLHDYAPFMKTYEGRARPKRPQIQTPNISQPIKTKGAFSNKRMKMTANQRSLSQNSNTIQTPRFIVKEEIDDTSANAVCENRISTPNNTQLTPKTTATTNMVTTVQQGKKFLPMNSKFLLVTNPTTNGTFKNGIPINTKLKPISVSDIKTPIRKYEILSNGSRKPTPITQITTNTPGNVKKIVIQQQSNNHNSSLNLIIQQKNAEIKSLQDEMKKMKKEVQEYKDLIISKDLEIEAMKNSHVLNDRS